MIIRNESDADVIYQNQTVSAHGQLSITDLAQLSLLSTDTSFRSDLMTRTITLSDGTTEYAQGSALLYISQFEKQLVQVSGYSTGVTQPAQQPFASPIYRTKVSGISAPIACAPSASAVIDFLITDTQILATGGEILVRGAEFGDSLMAEIYDVNSIVPAQVRATLCEAWPSVAKYIVKAFVRVDGNGFGYVGLDTRPLAAQIPQGTSMRITYTATAQGSERTCVVNYFLNKQLPASSLV